MLLGEPCGDAPAGNRRKMGIRCAIADSPASESGRYEFIATSGQLRATSRDDSEFFAQLHRLGAALGAQFVKDATGVSLYGVFAHKELFGDLPVAETLGDEPQYFQFARRDGQGFAFPVVGAKGFAGWNGDFFYDHALLFAGQLQAKPDAESGKCGCNQASVDFDRVLDDEEAVLRPFQCGDEDAGDQTIQEDMAFHGLGLGLVFNSKRNGYFLGS